MPRFETGPLKPTRLQEAVAAEFRKGRVLIVTDIEDIAESMGYKRGTGRAIPGTIVGKHFTNTTGLKVDVPYPGIYVARDLDAEIKEQRIQEALKRRNEQRSQRAREGKERRRLRRE
jgi:hypothetical protein